VVSYPHMGKAHRIPAWNSVRPPVRIEAALAVDFAPANQLVTCIESHREPA
jgi:hypothetical protein